MPAKEPPQLNQIYQTYLDNPISENYEAFGAALMPFVEATVVKSYGSRFLDLEDIVAEACLSVIKDLLMFDPQKSSFTTWATNVTLHTCIDALRKDKSQQSDELEAAMSIIYEPGPSIDMRIDLDKLLSKLSKEENELAEMKMHGFSNEEIAAELDTTVDAVKSQWKRLRLKLRTLEGGK